MHKRYILFGSLLTLIVLITMGLINIYKVKKEIIYIKDLAFYPKRVTEIKDSIEKLEDDNCKISLLNMLNRINATHFEQNTTLEEYYQTYYRDNLTFLDYFAEVKSSCELLDENTNAIYITTLAAIKYPNEVKMRYLLRHEFFIKDTYSRAHLAKDNDEIGTFTTKYLELQVLTDLIKEVKS